MITCTEEMLKKWELYHAHRQSFDIVEEMMNLTSEIAAKSLFSSDISGFKEEVLACINNLNLSIGNMIKAPFNRFVQWLPTKNNLFFQKNLKKFDKIIFQLIERRRKVQNHQYYDLLQMLLEAKDEETGESMNNLQLRDEVMTLFSAGTETSSNALSWAIFLLCANPDKKEKLQQEIKEVIGNRSIQLSDIQALTYTNQVIQETLRLYPPAWIVGRASKEADEIDGYQILPKTQILMPTWVIHRHPDLWENSSAFSPERFESEQAKQRHKFAYFPFGGGPRFCIGNNFAMMEMTLALAMIFQRFDIELLPHQNIAEAPMVTLKPQGVIAVNLSKSKLVK
jgi:cytochrome P450